MAETTNDFEWEASKENVQVIKKGRNINDLNKALKELKNPKAIKEKKGRMASVSISTAVNFLAKHFVGSLRRASNVMKDRTL